jgi:hypothetical protein
MSNYNRSSSASGGDAGYGPGGDAGSTWPDGTSKSSTSQGDRPDPRAPQRAPGTLYVGKNFAARPELIAKGFRGGDEVRIGPGSEQWMRGAADELNKVSYTTSEVAGPRRRRPK